VEKEVLMQGRGLCKAFGPTIAVDDVTIDIYKGEIRGLIGENGSGKSTLVSIFSGILKADHGSMKFLGNEYAPHDLVAANKCGVSIVVQEMGTIDGLTVSENVFLGDEKQFFKRGFRNSRLMDKKAKALLEEYNLPNIDTSLDVGHYTFEERKLIELVKAVYYGPKLFIVDETTTALSMKGREELYKVIKDVRSRGGTVIFISHDLMEVLGICDSITVFRDGKLISTVDNKNIGEDDLKKLMVGRNLEHRYYREDYDGRVSDEVVMKVEQVETEDMLKDISFDVHRGEILGIGGLTDSGMHELGKVLFGALKKTKGTVTLLPSKVQINKIGDAIKNGMGYVSKNRNQEALIAFSSILDNVCLGNFEKVERLTFISRRKERSFTQDEAKKLNIKMTSVDQTITSLSGGNKQKVALTKWLARDSAVLVLDCPTRGIDVMVKATIYDLMSKLKESGKTIIMISEELLELKGMCDRIIVLKEGKMVAEISRRKDLSEEEIIRYMI
jgi:ABC-type sugar transport system ATPase subunit